MGGQRTDGRRAGGFTLIELLVVVAVIAVLIGVLLPALGGARTASVRAASVSNQRQLSVALMVYAEGSDGRMPLGFSLGPGEGWKQYNYLVRTNPAGGEPGLRWMGLLYERGLLSPPQAYFCPAEEDPLMGFDTPDNPWPPDDTAPPGKSTRIGYGVRPVIGWPFPSDAPQPEGMPRRRDLSPRTAIIADLIHKPARLESRHGDGVHVTHADGSSRWQDRAVLDRVRVDGAAWSDTDNTGFDTAFNALFLSDDPQTGRERGLWAALDRK